METMGIAIIGAGMRSQMLIDYLAEKPEQARLVGIYDLMPRRAEVLLAHFDLEAQVGIYHSLEQVLEDKNVHALFVATPDGAHAETVIAALEAGKHIYCEKPLEITLERCDAIIEKARHATGVFYVGMNLRHGPVHETVHQIVHSGAIGKALTIDACEYYYGGRTYFRRWNRFRKHSGGLWITKACHDFDLLNWIAGTKPVRVSAFASLSYYRPRPDGGERCRDCPIRGKCPDFYDIRKPRHIPLLWDQLAAVTEDETGIPRDICLYNSEKDTFDNGIATVEYEGDIRATYVCNMVAPCRDFSRRMTVLGTDGAIDADLSTGMVTQYDRHSSRRTVHDLQEMVRTSSHGGADARILDDFFRCCREGDAPRSSWQDGRMSLALGLAATQASDTGQVVPL